jgi:capsule polysaccharide export protein KpsC/LpsZ
LLARIYFPPIYYLTSKAQSDTILKSKIKEKQAMRQPRAVTDKRYEEKHKEERKAKSLVWGTSVPRQFAEEINAFLEKHHISKVKLIEAGFNALMDEVAESDLGLAKIMDGYDDFFETEKK